MFHHAVLLLEDGSSSDRIAIEYMVKTYEMAKNFYAEDLSEDVFVYHIKAGTDALKSVTTTDAHEVSLSDVTRAAAYASGSGEYTEAKYAAVGIGGSITNCQRFVINILKEIPALSKLKEEYTAKYTVHGLEEYKARVAVLVSKLGARKQAAVAQEAAKLEASGTGEDEIFEYIFSQYCDD